MRRHGARAFIDALIAGRRPPRFHPSPDEIEELRTAIELSSARPGAGVPDDRFVENLWAELQTQEQQVVPPGVTPLRRPGRNLIVSLAAAAALVAGTVAVTEAVDHRTASRPAASAIAGHRVLTASFVSSADRDVGHITAFGGSPSWVFMNVTGSRYDGPVTCLLETDSGSVAAAGTFNIQGGTGEWARPLPGGVTHLKGARLVAPTGVTLATATF
jgi:hypothetical protein